MSSPRPTLGYSTLPPGEPIFSARTDGRPGLEIDIPPQSDRWRASWPPRTAGRWLAVIFTVVGAAAPLAGAAWWWLQTRKSDAMVVLVLGAIVEFFLLGGLAWFILESGRRRTTIRAGPDGLTVATVGGTAWPSPHHFPRAEIRDVILNPAGYESNGQVVLLLERGGDFYQGLGGTMLLSRKHAAEVADRLREALGMPPSRFDITGNSATSRANQKAT